MMLLRYHATIKSFRLSEQSDAVFLLSVERPQGTLFRAGLSKEQHLKTDIPNIRAKECDARALGSGQGCGTKTCPLQKHEECIMSDVYLRKVGTEGSLYLTYRASECFTEIKGSGFPEEKVGVLLKRLACWL